MRKIILIVWTISLFSCSHFITTKTTSSKIDRQSLVTRHRVTLNGPDTLGSLSVGNGEFAFTVDVSGLQTFSKEYENGISLGTQTQWGWHMYPLEKNFTLSDVASLYESCDGVKTPYAIQHGEGPGKEATEALRANPHRLHLGLIGLVLLKEDGSEVKLEDLKAIHQQLDLWTGKIETHYEVEGTPVKVILYGHQQADGIAAKIESPLIEKQRLRIKIDFPYAAGTHTCPGYDWNNPEKHKSVIISQGSEEALIKRTLDQTAHFAHISWTGEGKLSNSRVHHYDLQPSKNNQSFEFAIQFQQDSLDIHKIDFKSTAQSSIQGWKRFWTTGGVVDFSACTDLRAHELERRVVLSQYLTKIQCSGSMPPQETGLTMNSWFGKFHLEMHWWHAAHFALWGRDTLLTKSMEWYKKVLPKAEATARWQGYKGARWQKMTDPSGNESPSSVGAFIIWQQPHPIYMAELLYRNNPTPEILNAYKDLVFRTADFMTSFLKSSNGKYHLCHPIIPAQEIFDATRTDDPTFELQYWYFGIQTAQKWRKRLGMDENVVWKEMLNNLAPLTITNNLYAPCAEPVFRDSYRRDHPAVLGAYGFLPYNDRVDTVIMNKTFEDIANNWQWNATWGWDYPLMAMTATRLNKPEQALDFLLKDVQKNTYLINGHNYQDKRLRLYLPGNGGLLAAIAMMTAGWDGNKRINPGFPKNGAWNVRWEGIKPTP